MKVFLFFVGILCLTGSLDGSWPDKIVSYAELKEVNTIAFIEESLAGGNEVYFNRKGFKSATVRFDEKAGVYHVTLGVASGEDKERYAKSRLPEDKLESGTWSLGKGYNGTANSIDNLYSIVEFLDRHGIKFERTNLRRVDVTSEVLLTFWSDIVFQVKVGPVFYELLFLYFNNEWRYKDSQISIEVIRPINE